MDQISPDDRPLVKFYRFHSGRARAATRRSLGGRLDADARISLLRGDDAPPRRFGWYVFPPMTFS